MGEEPERLRARDLLDLICRDSLEAPLRSISRESGEVSAWFLDLLAEVERLAGERDEARASLAEMTAAYKWENEDRERLAGRVAALEAENKLLAAALKASNNALLDVGGSE
jgi:hypothetical protein